MAARQTITTRTVKRRVRTRRRKKRKCPRCGKVF